MKEQKQEDTGGNKSHLKIFRELFLCVKVNNSC